VLFTFFFLKTQYPIQGSTNLLRPIPPPTYEDSVWSCPPKLAPEGIEHETLRGAGSDLGVCKELNGIEPPQGMSLRKKEKKNSPVVLLCTTPSVSK